MGFLDDVQSTFNRGVAGANRTANTVKLKGQLSDALKRRQALAAQLGASLYEETRGKPEFRNGRETIYDGIASIDAERAQYQAEIDRIEAEARAAHDATSFYICPFCGSQVGVSDMFCVGCGKSISDIKAALASQATSPTAGGPTPPSAAAGNGPACPNCGASMGEGDLFCMSCGHKLEMPVNPPAVEDIAPDSARTAESDEGVLDTSLTGENGSEASDAPATDVRSDDGGAFALVPTEMEAESGPTPVDDDCAQLERENISDADNRSETQAPEKVALGQCPACGASFDAGDKFCMSCGAKLQQAEK